MDSFKVKLLREQFEVIERLIGTIRLDLIQHYEEAVNLRIQDPFTPWIKDQIEELSKFVYGEYIIWCKGFKKTTLANSQNQFQVETQRNQFQHQINSIISKVTKVQKQIDAQVQNSILENQKQIDVLMQKLDIGDNNRDKKLSKDPFEIIVGTKLKRQTYMQQEFEASLQFQNDRIEQNSKKREHNMQLKRKFINGLQAISTEFIGDMLEHEQQKQAQTGSQKLQPNQLFFQEEYEEYVIPTRKLIGMPRREEEQPAIMTKFRITEVIDPPKTVKSELDCFVNFDSVAKMAQTGQSSVVKAGLLQRFVWPPDDKINEEIYLQGIEYHPKNTWLYNFVFSQNMTSNLPLVGGITKMIPFNAQICYIQMFQYQQASGAGLAGLKLLDSCRKAVVEVGSHNHAMQEVALDKDERVVQVKSMVAAAYHYDFQFKICKCKI